MSDIKSSDLFKKPADAALTESIVAPITPGPADTTQETLSTGVYLSVATNALVGGSAVTTGQQYIRTEIIKTASHVSGGVAQDVNDFIWTWGTNANGEVGDNTANTTQPGSASSPVQINNTAFTTRQWRSLSQGVSQNSSTLALDNNSYAWAWGTGSNGQLGNNDVSSTSSPVSVVGGRQFRTVNGVDLFSLALDSNSYAWAWGL